MKINSFLGLTRTGLLVVTCLIGLGLIAGPAQADLAGNPIRIGIDQHTTTSLAWGDVDNDGDLDLAVGNSGAPNRVYLNHEGVLQTLPTWTAPVVESTESLAWGDMNNDGYLDLAVGNFGQGERNRVYLNESGSLQPAAAWVSPVPGESTRSIAWGDMNKDGYLDLALGNRGSNKVYLNGAGILMNSATWISSDADETRSVAWGDMDGDGNLDLAVGNWGSPNKVYLNTSQVLASAAGWIAPEADETFSVAWGDIDGDDDLDLAAGNTGDYDQGCLCFTGAVNKIYLNENQTLSSTATLFSTADTVTLSLAWGDWDGDGDLDLAAANHLSNQVYQNENGSLQPTPAWSDGTGDFPGSIAWGDVDNDGDLDLAVGNLFGSNKLYLNQGSTLQSEGGWLSDDTGQSMSVAWGDVDGDDDLDLAVGNGWTEPQANKLYLNDAGNLETTPAWSSTELEPTNSIAWGDVDGDGDLDLAAGNGCTGDNPPVCYPSRLYRNDGMANNGQTPLLTPVWTSAEADNAAGLAWGDVDGDGDLDLAIGNLGGSGIVTGAPNRVYLNEAGNLQATAAWSSADSDQTRSVVWGDVEGDGDLDLAVANRSAANKVYLNEGGLLQPTASWSSDDAELTRSVAWGDIDGDGDLDLAAGNELAPNKIYLNIDGTLQTVVDNPQVFGPNEPTWSVAWGDGDGDGDLDLAVGNLFALNQLYQNDRGTLQLPDVWNFVAQDRTVSVAWGDVDGDGDLDLAAAQQDQPSRVYRNHRRAGTPLVNNPPAIVIKRPDPTALAAFFSTPHIIRADIIALSYTLFDAEGDQVLRIFPEFSPNGGGQWLAATPGPGGDGLTNLAASPAGTPHTFVWNVAKDLIKSDHVLFRIRAQPGYRFSPIMWPAVESQTFPFRVEAEWFVKVVNHTGQPLEKARVYQAGQLLTTTVGSPRLTNRAGLIQLDHPTPGQPLIALAQTAEQTTTRAAHDGWAYRTYITNLNLNNSGVPSPTLIGQPGEQRLTVRPDEPLILFNLVASVEWDADAAYLAMLEDAFRKASVYLYDVTDGQMAFGQVAIYDRAQHWSNADFQFSTKNTVRPYAFVGGIISQDKAHTIRVGRFWDGDSGSSGNWNEPKGYRTLIHEFSHYALHLYDSHIIRQVDDQGNFLGEINAVCTSEAVRENGSDATNASMMYYHYNASELADKTHNWDKSCEVTEQYRLNGEADWETVLHHYGWQSGIVVTEPTWILNTPSSRGGLMAGPAAFPGDLLPFPEITLNNSGVAGGPSRQLTVRDPQGQPSANALVALYTTAEGVTSAIDQGLTNRQGRITIYGAAAGDVIRASTFNAALAGAVTVGNEMNYELILSPTSAGRSVTQAGAATPYLNLVPGTDGTTLALEVYGAAAGGNMIGVIVPDAPGSSAKQTPLAYTPGLAAYRGQVSFAGVEAGSGTVQVSGLAGSQVIALNSDYNLQQVRAITANHLYSEDGNFELHLTPGSIPADGYATILPTGYVPGPLPEGKQVIGSAYQVRLSGALVELDQEGLVRLHYHPAVMGVYTDTAIYYWDAGSEVWQKQGGEPGEIDNALAVPVTRLGIYALMGVAAPEVVYLPVITK